MQKISRIYGQFELGNFQPHNLQVLDNSLTYKTNDDDWYKNLENWRALPRGLATVSAMNNTPPLATLRGLPKFGDERYYYGSIEGKGEIAEGTTSYVTTKANGECCHITFFKHNDEWFIFGGSKNVHVVAPVNKDNTLYPKRNDKSTSYAYEMVEHFLTQTIDEELMQLCVDNQYTLVGEYISLVHPHIVKYNEEHISFFAITSPNEDWCLPPKQAQEIFKKYHLRYVDVFLTDITQVDVQGAENLEGYVSYHVNKEGKVVLVKKHKALLYQLLRSVRECLKNHQSISKRLATYHVDVKKYEKDIKGFYRFCLKNGGLNPKLSIYEQYTTYQLYDDTSEKKHKLVVMLVGVPGTGKTTIGSYIAYNKLREGINAVYVDQDLCHSRRDLYQSRILELLNDDTTQCIIVGKSNTTAEARRFISDSIEDSYNSCVLVVVELEAAKDNLDDLVQRVLKRKHHLSLTKNVRHVIQGFLDTYEKPVAAEFPVGTMVVRLPYDLSLESKMKVALSSSGHSTQSVLPSVEPVWNNWIGLQLMLTKEQREQFLGMIPEHLPVRHTSFHVTLAHSANMQEHVKHDKYFDLFKHIGETFEVKVSDVRYNEEICAAFVLDLDERLYAYTKVPHVTLAKASKSVPAVNSNEMMLKPTSIQRVEMTLKGKVVFN